MGRFRAGLSLSLFSLSSVSFRLITRAAGIQGSSLATRVPLIIVLCSAVHRPRAVSCSRTCARRATLEHNIFSSGVSRWQCYVLSTTCTTLALKDDPAICCKMLVGPKYPPSFKYLVNIQGLRGNVWFIHSFL